MVQLHLLLPMLRLNIKLQAPPSTMLPKMRSWRKTISLKHLLKPYKKQVLKKKKKKRYLKKVTDRNILCRGVEKNHSMIPFACVPPPRFYL